MFSIKLKVLALSTVCATMIPLQSSYAITKDIRELVNFQSDVNVAAAALAKEIRDDDNGNHNPIPGETAYEDLDIVYVDPNFSGTLEIDDHTGFIKRIEVSSVSFQAIGVPLFSDYAATLKLSVAMTPDCSAIVEGSRDYVVTKNNSSLVTALFKKDITGRSYNPKYYAYADVIFESMFTTNAKLHALCPHFIPHAHKK